MKTVVVTGPMGGGKSTFTRLLAEAGAAVVDGDDLGHRVLARPDIQLRIAEAFGPEVVGAGGVDRRALGRLVFADPEALARLNRITHPPLAESARRRLQELRDGGLHALAVLEAAVYFLFPSPPPADLVVLVTASPEVRRQRLQLRDGLAPEAVDARLAAQRGLAEGWRRADLVLANDGDRSVLVAGRTEVLRRLGLDPGCAGPAEAGQDRKKDPS